MKIEEAAEKLAGYKGFEGIFRKNALKDDEALFEAVRTLGNFANQINAYADAHRKKLNGRIIREEKEAEEVSVALKFVRVEARPNDDTSTLLIPLSEVVKIIEGDSPLDWVTDEDGNYYEYETTQVPDEIVTRDGEHYIVVNRFWDEDYGWQSVNQISDCIVEL